MQRAFTVKLGLRGTYPEVSIIFDEITDRMSCSAPKRPFSKFNAALLFCRLWDSETTDHPELCQPEPLEVLLGNFAAAISSTAG